MTKKASILFIITFLTRTLILGQGTFFKEIDFLRKFELDSITIENPNSFASKMILWQKNYLSYHNIYSEDLGFIENIELPENEPLLGSFLFYINKGDFLFYNYKTKNIEAKNYYVKALNISQKHNNKQLICEALKKILDINRYSYLNDNDTSKYYINIYKENAYDRVEKISQKYYSQILSFQYSKVNKWDKQIEKELLTYTENSKDYLLVSKIYHLLGTYYSIKDYKKAISYEEKALKVINNIKYNYISTYKKIILIALARYYLYDNNKTKSTSSLNKISSKNLNKLEEQYDRYKYLYQSQIDSINNNFKSAYNNQVLYIIGTELENISKNENLYKEIETKYQTEKKEKENLQLKQDNLISEQKRKQNRNLLYGSLVFISLGGAITYLTLKNSKRKRQLAEQQKELEKQKNITLIKEQEIITINAMIDGQEKERVRIAEDLHDNIGSVLATLKLHFENLKLNREKKHFNQEELYEKTEDLIDETYQKVRSIAHAKNAGVIANKGLLIAVKIMAEKISAANKTKIEVLDFGLNKRLENNLEIAVFRIIQELTTNIIKHSEAKNATINISQFDNILNIIIEDDGKGFTYHKSNLKNGMGLNSIKTRIEHLNGTFDVDSTINKGTNIIINLPLNKNT